MTRKVLGYNKDLKDFRKERQLDNYRIVRIYSQHKDRYGVITENDRWDAEIVGNLRFTTINKNELPTAGDWVAMLEYDDNKALIHAIFPENLSWRERLLAN